MKVIDLKSTLPNLTVFSYGQSRTGKTRWAGTWPRPLFLSDVTEGGWETLRTMPDTALYEPGVRPDVWGIESFSDMPKCIADVIKMCEKQPGRVRTLVIDSISFYQDLYVVEMERLMPKKNGEIDTRALYGNLFNHLRWLMVEIGKLPLNIVYLALEKAPDDKGNPGGPLLSGRSAQAAPARCGYFLYHRIERVSLDSPPIFEVRTKPYSRYLAGTRAAETLPDPLPEPTYRGLAGALGLKVT